MLYENHKLDYKDVETLFAKAESELHAVILIFVGIALTLLLSINIFSYPFKWIQMGVNKLYSLNKNKT